MLKRLGQQFSRTRLAAWLGAALIRGLCNTLRWELMCGPEEARRPLAERDSYLVGFWHNRLFVSTEFYRRYFPQGRGVAMISQSRDGELFTGIIECLGFGTVRGSSSKGARAVVREVVGLLRNEKADIGITPDGPRGPKYHVQPGILQLAQMTGKQIMLWRIEFEGKWELKSWDRFQIPKPFTRARVWIEGPFTISPDMSVTAFETWRQRVQQLLGTDL